jgi:hypothetical protein
MKEKPEDIHFRKKGLPISVGIPIMKDVGIPVFETPTQVFFNTLEEYLQNTLKQIKKETFTDPNIRPLTQGWREALIERARSLHSL